MKNIIPVKNSKILTVSYDVMPDKKGDMIIQYQLIMLLKKEIDGWLVL